MILQNHRNGANQITKLFIYFLLSILKLNNYNADEDSERYLVKPKVAEGAI